jgi:hypothetical protein
LARFWSGASFGVRLRNVLQATLKSDEKLLIDV